MKQEKRNPKAVAKRKEELTTKIVFLYKEGYSYREMSKMLNVSHAWAHKLHRESTVGDNSLTVVDSSAKINP